MSSLKKLTLIAPILLEEEVVDALLEHDTDLTFVAGQVYAHASDGEGLSLMEQVSGRKRKVRFEIEGSESVLNGLLSDLKARFQGAGIHFWIQPIEIRGTL
jgi:Protein of unknown function (DUF3240)